MKMRKIGRILTVMFLTGGLMTGCQKKQTVVLPEKEQKEEATETESKNKETQEISFDEELPKDYEGTLTMWGGYRLLSDGYTGVSGDLSKCHI